MSVAEKATRKNLKDDERRTLIEELLKGSTRGKLAVETHQVPKQCRRWKPRGSYLVAPPPRRRFFQALTTQNSSQHHFNGSRTTAHTHKLYDGISKCHVAHIPEFPNVTYIPDYLFVLKICSQECKTKIREQVHKKLTDCSVTQRLGLCKGLIERSCDHSTTPIIP